MKIIDKKGNVVSTVTLPRGEAGKPPLRFTGDTQSGIYSPGPDTISLGTLCTEQIRLNTAGPVSLRQRLEFEQLVVPVTGSINAAAWEHVYIKLVAGTGLNASFNLTGITTRTVPITGLSPFMTLHNRTNYRMVLKHESTSSSAAYRFSLPNAVDAPINDGESVILLYDYDSSRWKLIAPRVTGVVPIGG